MAGKATSGGDGPNLEAPVSNTSYIGTPLAAERAKEADGDGGGGGGCGTYDGLSIRVQHLEVRMNRVESKLDTILDRLGAIATKAEMRNVAIASTGVFLALIAVLVTAMGWLETRAARVGAAPAATIQPVIIQIPAPSSPPKKGNADPVVGKSKNS